MEKKKVQKNAQFPLCGQTKAFRYEIVFRGIQPCFLHGGSERLACFEPTKAARFLKTLEVHSVLYDQRKVRFKKGIFVFINVSWTFCTFWHRRERKPQNVHLTLIFCHLLNRFNLRESIHDPVCVRRIAF